MNYLLRGVWLAAALVSMLAPLSAQAQAPTGKLVLYTSQPERDATQTVDGVQARRIRASRSTCSVPARPR